jgi:hypothetical protein
VSRAQLELDVEGVDSDNPRVTERCQAGLPDLLNANGLDEAQLVESAELGGTVR